MMNLFLTFARHVTVWRDAWRTDTRKPLAVVPRAKVVEFYPAILEIEDAPPSPVGRAILWTIVLVILAGLVWSSVSWIDMVAVAPGQIIPSGYSKTIQPFETGVVAAIHVQDGQSVKKGEVLLDLDPTQNRADRDRAANEYRAANVETARLRALIAGASTFEPPSDADSQYVLLQQALLKNQLTEFHARVDAAQQLIGQRKAAWAQTRENILRLETTVPMETERAGAYKRLLERDAVTRLDYLQAEQQRVDRLQELAGQKKRLMQDQAAWDEADNNLRALVSEFHQTKQGELSLTETKAASLLQEVTKAGQKADLQRLVSPIDGVVQQLAIHTVGGVVTPAQPLLIVVPQDHPVEVSAQLANKDVGFVKDGQPVEIKVETFPFTLYGTIPGTVLSVSDDAVPLDAKKGKSMDELVFATRVSMERAVIPVEGKLVHLSPGMAVTVEIKTGQRRVIEYLLSPLLKSAKESMRER
ncbi:MAG TPA: HlyD family type I secretion periplasmic adaptor subunit [Nitrospira sp.]|nr:HlyD family type I secretion periplasmic adaptor subunit [Nitrospira sp.]